MSPELKNILVLAGAGEGREAFRAAATDLGRLLARSGQRLIYGGARVGLMGVLADAALSEHGQVIGVIPNQLRERELAHEGLTELIVVETMHERKQTMLQRADAVIALPGGLGTLEELLEAATWTQLGLHATPVGVLNVNGYFDPLLQMLDQAVTEGFLAPAHLDSILAAKEPEQLLGELRKWSPPDPKYGSRNGNRLGRLER